MGTNVQVCWEKFCRYWQVEPRLVPMVPGRYHLTGPEAAARCDENTIGVVAILGSTMDGSYEPVSEINDELDRLAAGGGPDVPIHVDGASGGFVAPFLQPDLVWDFRVPRVASINASGHKYGLVYPGVGWVVWREAAALPQDLVFNVNYLGGQMPTFALNFSRPGAQVAAQYYNFLRLGFSGYQRVHQACQDVAVHMSGQIAEMGPFELISEGRDLPVFAFKLADPARPATRVRPDRAAARPGLAGARLHLPRGPHRHGGDPDRDPQRFHRGPGRSVPVRPEPPLARAGGAPGTTARRWSPRASAQGFAH